MSIPRLPTRGTSCSASNSRRIYAIASRFAIRSARGDLPIRRGLPSQGHHHRGFRFRMRGSPAKRKAPSPFGGPQFHPTVDAVCPSESSYPFSLRPRSPWAMLLVVMTTPYELRAAPNGAVCFDLGPEASERLRAVFVKPRAWRVLDPIPKEPICLTTETELKPELATG